jgi:hypothetical protein
MSLALALSRPLYSTFGSPWAEVPCTRDPQFSVPQCYSMQPAALKTGHLEKFQLETLFYIFYAMPKDQLQGYAAQELYNRKWKYHKVRVCVCVCDRPCAPGPATRCCQHTHTHMSLACSVHVLTLFLVCLLLPPPFWSCQDKKMWFSGQPDLLKAQGAPSDGLIAFDAHRWQRQVVPSAVAASLMASFLPEEEVRMTQSS